MNEPVNRWLQTGTAPGAERPVVANLAGHLAQGGRLVAGFQLQPGRLDVRRYDELAAESGITLVERWSTWHRDAWHEGDGYAVSVHEKPSEGSPEGAIV